MWGLSLDGMIQTIKTGWKAKEGGDWKQIGGEFLFIEKDGHWHCEWAHRMKNTRDHAEVSELRHILGLGEGTNEKTISVGKV